MSRPVGAARHEVPMLYLMLLFLIAVAVALDRRLRGPARVASGRVDPFGLEPAGEALLHPSHFRVVQETPDVVAVSIDTLAGALFRGATWTGLSPGVPLVQGEPAVGVDLENGRVLLPAPVTGAVLDVGLHPERHLFRARLAPGSPCLNNLIPEARAVEWQRSESAYLSSLLAPATGAVGLPGPDGMRPCDPGTRLMAATVMLGARPDEVGVPA